MQRVLLVAAALLLLPSGLHSQSPDPPSATAADSAAIRQTAMDYIEAWYTADGDQMARATHPDLAKRWVSRDDKGASWLVHSSADGLVHVTRDGHGNDLSAAQRQAEVRILDVYGDMASVRLTSTKLVDYMQLARWNGEWKIINVLWDFRPAYRP